jgi:hypothetical protein
MKYRGSVASKILSTAGQVWWAELLEDRRFERPS